MLKQISDSVDQIPVVGSIGYSSNSVGHPITLTLIRQLAQDFTRTIGFDGNSDSVQKVNRLLIVDYWLDHLSTAIELAIKMGGTAYLVLDFGDPIYNWEEAPASTTQIKPYQITETKPTIELLTGAVGILNDQPIHAARYLEISNPYAFRLQRVLDSELFTLDKITKAIANNIESGGQIRIGISNLFQLVAKGGKAVTNLTNRLLQLRSANTGNGVFAYDRESETVDIIPKPYRGDHESVQVVKDRITAITGIPSFTIWGTTEGGSQFGIDKSLSLYSQRIGSMASISLGGSVSYLGQLLSSDPEIVFRVGSVFGESATESIDRLSKKTEILDILRNAQSITAIEMRDSMAGESSLGLVLNPNPVLLSGSTNQEVNSDV